MKENLLKLLVERRAVFLEILKIHRGYILESRLTKLVDPLFESIAQFHLLNSTEIKMANNLLSIDF